MKLCMRKFLVAKWQPSGKELQLFFFLSLITSYYKHLQTKTLLDCSDALWIFGTQPFGHFVYRENVNYPVFNVDRWG